MDVADPGGLEPHPAVKRGTERQLQPTCELTHRRAAAPGHGMQMAVRRAKRQESGGSTVQDDEAGDGSARPDVRSEHAVVPQAENQVVAQLGHGGADGSRGRPFDKSAMHNAPG